MKYYKKGLLAICFFTVLLCGCDKEENPSRSIRKERETSSKKTTSKKPVEKNIVKSNEEAIKNLQKKLVLPLSISVQETPYYCGPAVVQTILRYNNIEKTQNELAQELQTSPITGSEYVDITRVLNTDIFHNDNPSIYEDGYHVQTLAIQEQDPSLKQQFIDRMRANVDHGYPSVVAIDLHTLYPPLAVANHVIICSGYQTKNANDVIEYFYIEDPYYGVQDETYGGLKIVTPDELWDALVYGEEPAYIY